MVLSAQLHYYRLKCSTITTGRKKQRQKNVQIVHVVTEGVTSLSFAQRFLNMRIRTDRNTPRTNVCVCIRIRRATKTIENFRQENGECEGTKRRFFWTKSIACAPTVPPLRLFSRTCEIL